MKVLPGKWVFNKKFDLNTKQYSTKVRYIVYSNFEAKDWSSEEIYVAVANVISIRIFLAIIAVLNLVKLQYDFKLAYLNATILDDHEYYVKQPPGIGADETLVWRLQKALYDLRRSTLY